MGEHIPENKIVKNILRSLPSRFDSKVDAIEDNKDLDALRVKPSGKILQNLRKRVFLKGSSVINAKAMGTLRVSMLTRKKPLTQLGMVTL